MKLRTNKYRKFFFNVSVIVALAAASLFIFPGKVYHVFLFFLYRNDVERVSPEPDLTSRYLVLDAREKVEFYISHLSNAQWAGFTDFDVEQVQKLPKDTAILVYCSVGYRSEAVGKRLIESGFTNVKNLYGGLFEWKNEGLPVYRHGVETDSVHTFGPGWGFFLREGVGVLKIEN